MGSLVARAIAHKETKAVFVANRTFHRAVKLAEEVGGRAVRYDNLERYMVSCDVVISATSAPHYIITRDVVERVMKVKNGPLLIIDIALPRDVEESVAQVEGVTLYTIDDLKAISQENLRKRLKEAKKAEKIIAEELEHLKMKLKDIKADSAIHLLYARAEVVKKEEVIELYNKLKAKYDVDESSLPLLESFANSLIKKFLRSPTVRLRDAARNGRSEVIEAVHYLFGGEDFEISDFENEEAAERQLKAPVQRSKT
jgi:glutamyl-tRNA reductase